MAKIKVVLEHPLYNGMVITIGAPCECSAVTGLTVYSDGVSKSFAFRDAHGNDLTGLGNLFSEGAYIRAVLDTENGYAYIQNADTNGYIERMLAEKFSKNEDFVLTEGIHFGAELPAPGNNGRAFVKVLTPTESQVIQPSNPVFFEDGISGASGVVGVSNNKNRVARYEFTTSAAAAGIAFEKGSLSLGNGELPALKFQITTDDSSYANAGESYAGTELTWEYNEYDKWYTFSGEMSAELLPNTKYYLWIFPATTTIGWLYWNYKDDVTATIFGRKRHGQIYLDTGTEWILCSYGSVIVDGDDSGSGGGNGVTFTPAVDADGNLSWTNDGGLVNPATVNIKGPAGEDGAAGKDGNGIKSAVLNADYTLTLTFDDGTSYTTPIIRGATGAAGSDGKDGSPGANGQDGADGKDGVSVTHSWNGTTLTVTSASGTSSADLKGDKGDKGDKGATGADGQDGFTPQKGIDYFTSEDKEVMVKEVLAALPIYDGEVVDV